MSISRELAHRAAAHACDHLAAMRISIPNWYTSAEDVDRWAGAILAAVDELVPPNNGAGRS